MIEDVFLRFELSISNLRGQTYDGASNMSGSYRGCQAIISDKQPLALYVHCGAHCVNLVAQSAAAECNDIMAAMSWLQELGKFFGSSIKFRQLFAQVAASDSEGPYSAIKPLCPTRWLMRTPAINSVVKQYAAVLESLEEAKLVQKDTRAASLVASSQKGSTLLLLQIALVVFGPLELLNKSLQSSSASVSQMLEAVKTVKQEILSSRTDESFHCLFTATVQSAAELDLEPIVVPRQRKPPKRFTGTAVAHQHTSAEEYYRAIHYSFIDAAVQQLDDRFDCEKTGLHKYCKLQNIILTGVVDHDVTASYPELNAVSASLDIELRMFRHQYKYISATEAIQIMRSLQPAVQDLFPVLKEYMKLLLVNPASSATAEHSFSSLRRLKTWLRNSMGQTRLNSCAVCSVHVEALDETDIRRLAEDFISRAHSRENLFGKFRPTAC